jgi:hypothetical protein
MVAGAPPTLCSQQEHIAHCPHVLASVYATRLQSSCWAKEPCQAGYLTSLLAKQKAWQTPRKPYFAATTTCTMESGSESSFQLLDTNELENTMEGAEEPPWDDTTAPSTPRPALDDKEAAASAGESSGGICS